MLEFIQFIELSKKTAEENNLRAGDELCKTYEGNVYVDMKKTIPVIVKGVGCIGVADIEKITMDSDNTHIDFKLRAVSEPTASAAYTLYKAMSAQGGNELAGLYRSKTNGPFSADKGEKNSNGSSLPKWMTGD